MATNDFLSFATAFGANVESQVDYAADTMRTLGQQPGVAKSALNNKALRQATFMVAALAQYMANITGNDVLDNATQADILATMALTWPGNTLPTQTILTATGTASGYLFVCSTANATVGATYTNNGHTYTVLSTLASGTLLFCSGASAPTSSGTLTKSAGTGDSTITFSTNQTLATYTVPANVRYLKIKTVGGGGGGQGGNNATPGDTGLGSYFGAAFLIAGGGLGGGSATQGTGGAGGTSTIGVGATGIAPVGGYGNPGSYSSINVFQPGGSGAATPFGGAGGGAGIAGGSPAAGTAGVTNTGAGGGGGNIANGSALYAGGGGGGGGYIEALITSPGASYFYAIGSGGAGSSAGATAGAGGNGGSGIIIIEEHYTG